MTARHCVSPEGYLGKFGSPKFTAWIVISFTRLGSCFPQQNNFLKDLEISRFVSYHLHVPTAPPICYFLDTTHRCFIAALLPCLCFTLITSTEVIWIQAWLRSPYFNLLFESGLGPFAWKFFMRDIWTMSPFLAIWCTKAFLNLQGPQRNLAFFWPLLTNLLIIDLVKISSLFYLVKSIKEQPTQEIFTLSKYFPWSFRPNKLSSCLPIYHRQLT